MDILLVDDHAATREAIGSLIEEEKDLTVVGEASGGEEGVRKDKAFEELVPAIRTVAEGRTYVGDDDKG